MHWLEEQIQLIDGSVRKYAKIRESENAKDMADRYRERELRSSFLEDIKNLVQNVSEIAGITGCVACHDGLLVAQAGTLGGFDAIAAAAQECINVANKSISSLELGTLRQVTIIGDQAKLALITTGEIAVCIVSPVETVLSQVLRDPG